MSKKAKELQGYKGTPNCCMNCQHFEKEIVEKTYQGFSGLQTWKEDKKLRCTLGGFAVKKMAVCEKFALKNEA